MYNLLTDTDSYKVSHYAQYPEGTQYVSSYIEARGSNIDGVEKTVFYGISNFIQSLIDFQFDVDDIARAKGVCDEHFGPGVFDETRWLRLLDKYDGHLPLHIQAVPEGTPVDVGNVLVQVQNTDPEFPWLTSYMETSLLRAIWYPTTVATISWAIKNVINEYLQETCDDDEAKLLDMRLHDFGSRGASSHETADIGGKAHLINFKGSDTLHAVDFMVGATAFSIPASEHSTITSWGKPLEFDAFKNMLEVYKGRLFACVCDSYNLWEAVGWWATRQERLKEDGTTVVIRPDSGDPVEITEQVFEQLWESTEGGTTNSKGYRVLPPQYKIIQGDGVDLHSIKDILENFKQRKICASNIFFGMGGALLQRMNRDTFRFAMKCSAIDKGDGWEDVYKDPITDKGKRSKKGRLALRWDEDEGYLTAPEGGYVDNVLQTVYKEGKVFNTSTFEQIRDRAILN